MCGNPEAGLLSCFFYLGLSWYTASPLRLKLALMPYLERLFLSLRMEFAPTFPAMLMFFEPVLVTDL